MRANYAHDIYYTLLVTHMIYRRRVNYRRRHKSKTTHTPTSHNAQSAGVENSQPALIPPKALPPFHNTHWLHATPPISMPKCARRLMRYLYKKPYYYGGWSAAISAATAYCRQICRLLILAELIFT